MVVGEVASVIQSGESRLSSLGKLSLWTDSMSLTGWKSFANESFFKVVKIGRSTMLFGLLVTTYSQALSHYCTVRELLPAAFPPWAGTFLIIQPGRLLIPLQSPC